MHRKPFKRIFHSVFTRLLVAIIIAGIAITIVVIGGFMTLRKHSLESIDRNLTLYIDYLITELGDPPDPERADRIARRTGMIIQFKSGRQQWETAEIPATLRMERARIFSRHPDREIGFYRGHHFMRIHQGSTHLTFILPWAIDDNKAISRLFVVMAALLVAILTGAYFYIRRVLKPIRHLKVGVEKVGAGNLGHRVPLGRDDEFRDLASAFNRMTERLEALLKIKEQLLLDVSHELRSPLTRLKVGLEFLPEGETRASLKEDINEMERMITEILEAARIRKSAASLNLARTKPADLMRTVLPDFENRPPGVVLKNLLEDELMLDAEKIETVLRNILDNASKYSAPDGTPVAVFMEMKNRYLTIIIEDEGIGIPEDALPYVFEPFYRADTSRTRETGGYGLGLSLCKTIMTVHNAEIEIFSKAGEGTRVVLSFPLGPETS